MDATGGWPPEPPSNPDLNHPIHNIDNNQQIKVPSKLLNNSDYSKIYENVDKMCAEMSQNNGVSDEFLNTNNNNGVHRDNTNGVSGDFTNGVPKANSTDSSLAASSSKLQQILQNDSNCFIKVLERRKRAGANNSPSSSKKLMNAKDTMMNNRLNLNQERDNIINNNNRFKILQEQDKDDSNMETEEQASSQDAQPAAVVENQKWCPYIYITGLKSSVIRNFILSDFASEINNNKVVLRTDGYGRVQVRVKNPDLHSVLFNNFKKSKNVEGHSFTPKSLRNPSILLKGLAGCFPPSDVREELLRIDNSLNIIQIKPFTTKWSKDNKYDLDIFLCTVNSNEDIVKLRKIKIVLHHRIWWDSIKREGPIQCFNCQRFGHGSRYCAYESRCVKCGKNHEANQTEDCTNKANDDGSPSQVFCINCEQAGHPASFSQCPKRLLHIKNQEIKAESSNTIKITRLAEVNSSATPFVTSNISYATTAKKVLQPRTSEPRKSSAGVGESSIFGDFLNESIKLFGVPINILIGKVKSFWPEYKQLNEQDKPGAYLDFIASLSP